MKLKQLKQRLLAHADKPVGFVFDDGDRVPGHFHVTEVGHVAKNFIDCGGMLRSASTVQLQVWLGSDPEHRLMAGKLAGILELAQALIPREDLEVEVEYENCVVSQYTLDEADVTGGELVFRLGDKHTDCLAKEACGVQGAAVTGAAAGSCASPGCC